VTQQFKRFFEAARVGWESPIKRFRDYISNDLANLKIIGLGLANPDDPVFSNLAKPLGKLTEFVKVRLDEACSEN
jgi:hypothetical protein